MISSPLRYPGGKAKLFPFFSEVFKANRLFSTEYCEPYAGGAGLAIRLLTNGFVGNISINDLDRSIYAFWISALRKTDRFCDLIEKTPITVDEWYRQKKIWEHGDIKNAIPLGFSAYFLNRTNRSGIIEGAGPIGGYAQKGKWKIDARLIKQKQINNLIALAKYSDQIEVSNLDALEYLKLKLANKNAFLYLDPPYFVKGQKLYKNFYQLKDHKQIASELKRRRKAKWVVSYDDVADIRDLYSTFSPIQYLLNYSAGDKMIGKEIIFLSDAIALPNVEGFKTAA